MNKEEYAVYLRSEHWRSFVRAVRARVKNCQSCGFEYELNVHHLTYENLGHEKFSDVAVLCKSCHSRIHFVEDVTEGKLHTPVGGLTQSGAAQRQLDHIQKASEKIAKRQAELASQEFEDEQP